MLYEGEFEVKEIDKEGKKFDKVSRIELRNPDLELTLDVHVELYPMRVGEIYDMALLKTLRIDQSEDTLTFNQDNDPTYADSYEYVMHGTVFEISQRGGEVYASFGGLLMCLRGGDMNALVTQIARDSRLYLCMRKSQ